MGQRGSVGEVNMEILRNRDLGKGGIIQSHKGFGLVWISLIELLYKL